MNNAQLCLSIGVPSCIALLSWVTVILAWFSNRSDLHRLSDKIGGEGDSVRSDVRGEIRELRSEMNRRFDAVDAELRYLHRFTASWTRA